MDTIRVIHDTVGQTLVVWFDDPSKEQVAEETEDEIVLMKDGDGRVIGFELLHFEPMTEGLKVSVETIGEEPDGSSAG